MEQDIRPQERYLMERFISASLETSAATVKAMLTGVWVKNCEYIPNIKSLSLDIETTMDSKTIHSIAVYGMHNKAPVEQVWLHWPATMVQELVQSLPQYSHICRNERQLLKQFSQWFQDYDPDAVIGWSLVQFDFQNLCARASELGVRLRLGRGSKEIRWQAGQGNRPAKLYTPGRVALDGIEVMRSATWQFESFALENVAQQLLGRGKDITKPQHRGAEIQRMYAKVMLLQPLLLGRQVSPGGFVMDSKPGLYRNVLVLDFKSLYPSIIRSFKINPLGLIQGLQGEQAVPGYKGVQFSREQSILPEIIADLWAAGDVAKAHGNTPLSTSIKIVMNACYGVLGSSVCRFYDQRLASSITLRGHAILNQTRDLIQQQGMQVIYSNTDSVFLWLGDENMPLDEVEVKGKALAQSLNDWWSEYLKLDFKLQSYLEIEFETYFSRFVMPTIRGQQTGSKKRYAGLTVAPDGTTKMLFKGLEQVRTDWTKLAKELQVQLYQRVFNDQPYADLIKPLLEQVRAGQLDHKLVYRKRLRRPLHDYQKMCPPMFKRHAKQRRAA